MSQDDKYLFVYLFDERGMNTPALSYNELNPYPPTEAITHTHTHTHLGRVIAHLCFDVYMQTENQTEVNISMSVFFKDEATYVNHTCHVLCLA